MNISEVGTEAVDGYEAICDFLKEVCTRYHLNNRDSSFNEREFIDWVVLQAGMLYIEYVLQPKSTNC